MHIILGFIIIAAGAMIVIKSEQVLNAFGRIAFFEKYLGTEGGSRLGYKLTGMLVVFFGILILTNMYVSFMEWMVSPLTQYSKQ